jgi:hypothetical protein
MRTLSRRGGGSRGAGNTSIMSTKSLSPVLGLITVLTILAGCQTQQQTIASAQETATQTALKRGQFELSCPEATATVLSNEMVQPILWGGRERVEYSIGVSGCGKKATYIVICPESDECFAGSGANNVTSN